MALASLHLTLSLLLILTLPPPFQGKQKQPIWIKPYIIDYQNGTVLRDTITNPPSFVNPPNTSHLRSKDISLSLSLSSTTTRRLRARVFLPGRLGPDPARKLPILVYFHGGAFCIGSPFSRPDTVFLARASAGAHVIALSLDYTLFPDDVIPAPYDEAWAFLKWAAGPGSDPWVARFGDPTRVFVGGDSAGGNIAHNMAIRAGMPGSPVRLTGAFLAMPYFLGSGRVPMEPEWISGSPNYKIWGYVCPGCKLGVDDPFINPDGPGAPSLAGLGCERMLVYAAEIDELYGRDLWYYNQVKESGWAGQARFTVAKGKGHVFHILEPHDPATTKLIQDLSEFLNA